MRNQPKRRSQLSPTEAGIIIGSGFATVAILIVVPLLFVIINAVIYHDNDDRVAFLVGLSVAIVFDGVIGISVPVRLRRLREKAKELTRR